MNLTDLQKELRALEGKLSALQVEIEGMKPKEEDSKKQDFERITKLAVKHRLEHVAIAEASEYLIKKYIRLLSFILSSAEKGINEKLLYLMRIVSSAKMKWTAEEVVQFGIEFDIDEIEESCRELDDYKYVLLADALIMLNFAEEGSQKEISLVADIAKFLNVDRDDLEVISKVVHSYLTNDYEPLVGYIGNGKKLWGGVFRQYIPLTWLEKQRVEVFQSNCRTLLEKYGSNIKIKSRSDAKKIIKKGDVLLALEFSSLSLSYYPFGKERKPFDTKLIESPLGGVFYYDQCCETEDLYTYIYDYAEFIMGSYLDAEVYVISIFDNFDNVDEWIESRYK